MWWILEISRAQRHFWIFHIGVMWKLCCVFCHHNVLMNKIIQKAQKIRSVLFMAKRNRLYDDNALWLKAVRDGYDGKFVRGLQFEFIRKRFVRSFIYIRVPIPSVYMFAFQFPTKELCVTMQLTVFSVY